MATILPGAVQTAFDNAQGFDSDSVITPATAADAMGQGYQFCLRYVSLSAEMASGDLTYQEALNIVNSGLALMPVQHVRAPGWTPSAQLGTTYGTNAANHAASVGFPAGVNIWLDLEGIEPQTPAQDVIAYCTSWYSCVKAANFLPGIYVGANAILNGQQLYDLPFEHYWQSASSVPVLPARGYQMQQLLSNTPINSISVDKDFIKTDTKGGLPVWLQLGNKFRKS